MNERIVAQFFFTRCVRSIQNILQVKNNNTVSEKKESKKVSDAEVKLRCGLKGS